MLGDRPILQGLQVGWETVAHMSPGVPEPLLALCPPTEGGESFGDRILGEPTSATLFKATTLKWPGHRGDFGHWSASQRLSRRLP